MQLQKELLQQVLEQSKADCSRICKNITAANAGFRLSEKTASTGFIFRHIGEATNLLAQFFGYETEVQGNTFGQTDIGEQYELEKSKLLFEQGYDILERLINETSDHLWLEEVDTAWFGKISRIRLFSLTLFHNSHHCGQIASAIAKGNTYNLTGSR